MELFEIKNRQDEQTKIYTLKKKRTRSLSIAKYRWANECSLLGQTDVMFPFLSSTNTIIVG